jgi:hypothetical protein
MTLRRSAALRAGVASFAVYFLPVVGPHTFNFLGEHVAVAISASEREPLWRITDIGVALLLHVTAFVVLYFFFLKPGLLRGAMLVLTVPVLFWCAEVTLLYAIPSIFLIESETASETGSWSEVCTAQDASIVSVRSPLPAPETSISEILVQTSQGKYGVVRVPGCEMHLLPLPEVTVQPGGRVDFMIGVTDILPGVAILFQKHETQNGRDTWWRLKGGEATDIALPTPSINPLLANDGGHIGWIERIPNTGPPVSERVVIRSISDGEPQVFIDLSSLGPASHALMNIDVARQEILISRNEEFAVVAFDGNLRSSIPEPEGVQPQPQTFLKLPTGWVAWDAYQERDPYRIAWELPAGSGISRVLKGRLINSVAASPSGNLIAVSVSTALNIGRIQDEVYVLRARDGEVIFRRYLPMYTRTPVLFPSGDVFAYSAGGATALLRVPAAER